jgi:Trk K+ transport system NAD-binding subunit
MHNIIYLLLRRMRAPLIVVILAYAVSILGLVLIPGIDDQGNPWRMDFFHAFYFISFTGSTIGFGEIPYPFTDAQRLWTTITMYTTVLSWLYAIGALLALIQDRAFRSLVDYAGFTRSVRGIKEPFYVVCGLGDAGRLVVRELAARGIRTVVVEQNEGKLHALQLEDLPVYVPGLCADASTAASLTTAGLKSPYCAGTIAITDSDHINLTIAITSKLLAPKLRVICRAETHDSQANMASFGTDSIINPYDTFAERFAMMFQSPSMYLVYEWLTSIRDAPLKDFVEPPKGKWVLCGFGRFGKAVQKSLSFEGIRTVIIESDFAGTQAPEGTIEGRGTEAITLYEADIDTSVGVIAGTDDDSNNLSIIITALAINKGLFTVARQNRSRNDAIFEAANIDLVVQPGTITGRRIVNQITTPLLTDFLRIARKQKDGWANVLVSRVVGVLTDRPPETWTLVVGHSQTPAIIEATNKGCPISLGMLCTDPRDLADTLPCVPLLLKRQHDDFPVPANDTFLQPGDQLLFCGRKGAETHMRWTVNDFNTLNYVCTGIDRPSGMLWRWLSGRELTE